MDWFNWFDSLIIHATFVVTFYVLARLSRIFGEARKLKPLFRIYYACISLSAAAFLLSPLVMQRGLLLILPLLLNTLSLTLSSAVTYFYWIWVPKELAKER